MTLLLVLCDVLGGFIALASGADSWQESWGFDTDTAVPLPVGLVQLALAWLAGRDVRPRVGLSAAVVLSLFCATSVLFGLFDGDLRSGLLAGDLGSRPAPGHSHRGGAGGRPGEVVVPAPSRRNVDQPDDVLDLLAVDQTQ